MIIINVLYNNTTIFMCLQIAASYDHLMDCPNHAAGACSDRCTVVNTDNTLEVSLCIGIYIRV
jgi:hypothetical protein